MIYKLSRNNWLLLLNLFSTYVNKKIQSTGQVIPSMRTPIANSPQKWKKTPNSFTNPSQKSTFSQHNLKFHPDNQTIQYPVHSFAHYLKPTNRNCILQTKPLSINKTITHIHTDKAKFHHFVTHYADSTTALSSKTGKHNWDFTFSNK